MVVKIDVVVDAPICACRDSQKNTTIMVDLQRVQISCANCGALIQTPFAQIACTITTAAQAATAPESAPSKLTN